MTTKDKDGPVVDGPFTEGLEKAAEDPNEKRREGLLEAIRTHAKNNRNVVKARRRATK